MRLFLVHKYPAHVMSASRFKKYRSLRKINYPIRPWLTLAIGTAIVVLANFLGPAAWIVGWLGATFILDDLIIYPFLQLSSSVQNLFERYKATKSSLKIAIILSCTLLGTLLIPLIPFFASIVTSILAQAGSIIILTGCITAGVILAKLLKFNSILGFAIGGFAALCIPVALPLMAEVYFSAAIMSAFFSAILGKTLLQVIYRIKYQHPNADGNFITSPATDQASPQNSLQQNIIELKKHVHQNSGIVDNLLGKEKLMTNSLSDILFLLNKAETTDDKQALRELLSESIPVSEKGQHVDCLGFAVFKLQRNGVQTAEEREAIHQLNSISQTTFKTDFIFGRDPVLVNRYYQLNHKQNLDAALSKCNDQTLLNEFRDNLKAVCRSL